MQGHPPKNIDPETTMPPPAADRVLDVRDLRCPLPVLRAVKALRTLSPGAVLEVWATDPASLEDMRALAGRGVADLLAQTREGGDFRHWLRRPAATDAHTASRVEQPDMPPPLTEPPPDRLP